MTQEEKAKRYDETLEQLKGLIEGTKEDKCAIVEEDIINIFPELKESEEESEDVKIRRAILDYLTILWGNSQDDICGVNVEDAIAWLEKQGEKPKKVSIWKHWKDGIAGNGEGKQIYLIKAGNTYNLSSCLCFECDYIELSELDNLLVEKQAPKPKWTEEDEKN